MTRHLPRAALAAGALATLVALGGCSLGYEPPGPPGRSGQPRVEQQQTAAEPTSGPAGSPATGLRQKFAGKVTQETACTPGTTELDATGQVVRLTGSCGTVQVRGTGMIVLADRITVLDVDAVGATVVVAAVETVTLAGTTNVVVWEGGNPHVTDTGVNNSARRENG